MHFKTLCTNYVQNFLILGKSRFPPNKRFYNIDYWKVELFRFFRLERKRKRVLNRGKKYFQTIIVFWEIAKIGRTMNCIISLLQIVLQSHFALPLKIFLIGEETPDKLKLNGPFKIRTT